MRSPPVRSLRRILELFGALVVLVWVGVTVLSTVVVAVVSAEVGRRSTAEAARTIAQAVAPQLQGATSRGAVLEALRPYFDQGRIERVKVWQRDHNEIVVHYSDEPRIEGFRRPFAADLGERLARGETVTFPVPTDAEHRYEGPGLIEVFIELAGTVSQPRWLELYIDPAADRTSAHLLAALLPVALIGPLSITVATLPLTRTLAYRLAQREAEDGTLLHASLAAAEAERQRLAAQVHDQIIPDLASLGLLLQRLGSDRVLGEDDRAALLAQADQLIEEDLIALRALLTQLAPPDFQGSLPTALAQLTADLGATLAIESAMGDELAPETSALLYRVARELIRNARDHAGPAAIQVALCRQDDRLVLEVADDGPGFDPAAPAPEGHLGLALIRAAVADAGGDLQIASGREGTRVRVSLPATRAR